MPRHSRPQVLQPGKIYEFPFSFTIPKKLLSEACKHETKHQSVHDAHLQLPPSIGAVDRCDDLAPVMSRVQYQVAARIISSSGNPLVTKTRDVCVIPAAEEQAPIDVQDPNSEFISRTEKVIRKSGFKGRLGSLSIEAEQPKSISLPTNYSPGKDIVSTMTTVRLRFDPAEEGCSPPCLTSLSSKLHVSTWHAVTPRLDFPKDKDVVYDIRAGLYSTSVKLSSCQVDSVSWTRHDEGEEDLHRQDSVISVQPKSDASSPSTYCRGRAFYTAELVVPVFLPKNKTWVPTFHSCLVSRTYALDISLGVRSAVGTRTMKLKLPLQISAEGSVEYQADMIRGQQLVDHNPLQNLLGSLSTGDVTRPACLDLLPEYKVFTRPILA